MLCPENTWVSRFLFSSMGNGVDVEGQGLGLRLGVGW